MNNDVALFLDLDNVVIGAAEVKLTFDIELVLNHIKEITNGRVALRRAYGDWRQHPHIPKTLAAAGFELQSTVRLNSMSKNLADMQMVVDSMETLIDGQNFDTYVLITGDRDFVPLVQGLRKRGKQVIGIGLKHISSKSLVRLCDQYIFYEDLTSEAYDLADQEVAALLDRAMEQLMQEKKRAPASLLKQRLQALSNGAFIHTPQGKKNFSKFLEQYPHLVALEQEETTVYVTRPAAKGQATKQKGNGNGRHLSQAEIERLLAESLDRLLQNEERVQASALKQQMQESSQGAFDEARQGDKSFRKFLERFPNIVGIFQENTTLYVGRPAGKGEDAATNYLTATEAGDILKQMLAELINGQPRVRASLVKQRIQEATNNRFNEEHLGFKSFRQFLEKHSDFLELQQKGDTLFVSRIEKPANKPEPRQEYRTLLKKRGLRVVPSEQRLKVLGDLIALLRQEEEQPWSEIVNRLADQYSRQEITISKRAINDVLRIAQRARAIRTDPDMPQSKAPVRLQLEGERLFQEMVMRCDAAYLRHLQQADIPLDLEEAALALYETVGHTRYLKIVLNRFSQDAGQ